MVTVLTIVAVACVLARDELGGGAALGPWAAAGWTLGPMAALAAINHVGLAVLARRVDRTGSWRAIRAGDRLLLASRVGLVACHGLGVFALGWLDAVRAVLGDGVLIDEAAAMAPVLAALAAGWFSAYPLDRRVREATLLRSLEDGLPVHAPPTRGEFVWMQARHQMALVLLGALPLAAWSEAATRVLDGLAGGAGPRGGGWADQLGGWLRPAEAREWAHLGLQVAMALVLFACLPWVIGRVWDTVRLAPGPLRDGLMSVCAAHGVRVRDLLVWRTRGAMVNGAVIGVLGPMRYVLLTDALLERLPEVQVRAVMAHEVGHVRHRHVPWLLVGLLASMGAALGGLDAIVLASGWRPSGPVLAESASGVIALAGLGLGFAGFGWVSRRFEWQADAFAVKHLSGARRGGPAVAITDEAVHAMVDALDAVARLNHLDPAAWSFRHGSVARRIARLRRLRGANADTLAIDRASRAIKIGSAVVLAAVVAWSVWSGR